MGRPKSEINGHLPPHMVLRVRGRVKHYYYATPGTNRTEIPLGRMWDQAIRRYHEIHRAELTTKSALPAGFHRSLFRNVVKNAKARGIEVNITAEDLRQMLQLSGGRCAVSGIEFDMEIYPGQRIRPWIPSVDRIDSKRPYEPENCRLVCASVNVAINQFGEHVLYAIAVGMTRSRGKRKPKLRKIRAGAEITTLPENV